MEHDKDTSSHRIYTRCCKAGGAGGVINNSLELEIGVPVPVDFVIVT